MAEEKKSIWPLCISVPTATLALFTLTYILRAVNLTLILGYTTIDNRMKNIDKITADFLWVVSWVYSIIWGKDNNRFLWVVSWEYIIIWILCIYFMYITIIIHEEKIIVDSNIEIVDTTQDVYGLHLWCILLYGVIFPHVTMGIYYYMKVYILIIGC